MIVLDASAAVRWASLPGERPIAPEGTVLIAPDLFVSEVQNAAFKYVRGQHLSRVRAEALVATVLELIDSFFHPSQIARTAWSLAMPHDHSPYDMLFLALAIELDTRVLTADRRFAKKLDGTVHARHVLLVEPLVS
jgi:predicted nucleic acid-binding protein